MRSLLIVAALTFAATAFAEITPEQAAKIDREKKKELDDIAKKYGNKKGSEMTNDERRSRMKEESEALNKVLDKNGATAKEYSKFEATASSSDRAAAKEKGAAMDKKEAADKQAADKAAAAGKANDPSKPGVTVENGITIERGTGSAPK
jgi:FKBP-type peptidyl-prolyl cis-trans isomerase